MRPYQHLLFIALHLVIANAWSGTYKCETSEGIRYQDQPCASSAKQTRLGPKPVVAPTPEQLKEEEFKRQRVVMAILLSCKNSGKCSYTEIERNAKLLYTCSKVEQVLEKDRSSSAGKYSSVWEDTYIIYSVEGKSALTVSCLDNKIVGASMSFRRNRYTGAYY